MPDEWTYDGNDAAALRALLDLPEVVLCERVSSTLDVAHSLAAAGAPAGTLVLAEEQTAGRGRGGRGWRSAPAAGIWLTLIERPADAQALELLSLRIGLRAAPVLERHAPSRVTLKWPNDLFVDDGKLAGVLIETRWRDDRPDWVAIGMGINALPPDDIVGAAALRPGTERTLVLAELIPALRAAAAARGPLTSTELRSFADRDRSRGRQCLEPIAGVVRGIDASGRLLVETADGEVAVGSGSLVLAD